MNIRKIISLLLVLFGELLLILCFVFFGSNLADNILILNIVVSSLIYGLLFMDILIPWVDFKDKSQKTIGSIGPRWFFTFLYISAAIGAMIFFAHEVLFSFTTQLLVQVVLFFLLLVGLYWSSSAAEKVGQIYIQETRNRSGIEEMKKAMQQVVQQMELSVQLPVKTIIRIRGLQENLRYLSPCNSADGFELEQKFVDEVHNLNACLLGSSLDLEHIDACIKRSEQALAERKQVYST